MKTPKITDAALDQLLNELAEFDLHQKRKAKYSKLLLQSKKVYRRKKILIGTGILMAACLIGFVVITLIPHNEQSTEKLVQQYYQTFDFQTEYRNDSSENKDYYQAIQYYKQGNLDEAASLILPLYQSSPKNPEYILFNALVLIAREEYVDALPFLETSISQGGSYEKVGLWYLALCQLALHQNQQAIQSLQRLISITDPPEKRKYQRILKEARQTIVNKPK